MRHVNELIITRGLPGSGKTKWTLEQIRRAPGAMVHVSRDLLREGVYGQSQLEAADESLVTDMQLSLIRQLLTRKKNVIADDTHLSLRSMEELYEVAQEFDGQVRIRIQDFPVDVKTCIQRDSQRANPVGENVIQAMADRYMGKGSRKELPSLPAKFYETVKPIEPLLQDGNLPTAWIVDMDNTLARMRGRGPFDWGEVAEDELIEHVHALVVDLHRAGHKIIIVTGRDGAASDLTKLWLEVHDVPYDEFYIREEGDNTPDNSFKSFIYETHLKGRYRIAGVLDDRHKVVTMWRKKGLFAAQVAPGLF